MPFDFSQVLMPPNPNNESVKAISVSVSSLGKNKFGYHKVMIHSAMGKIIKWKNNPRAAIHMIAGLAPATNIELCFACSILACAWARFKDIKLSI